MRLAWLAVIAGCGRIDFDPFRPGVPPNDGKLPNYGNGATGDSGSGAVIDATVSACVGNGMPRIASTAAGPSGPKK